MKVARPLTPLLTSLALAACSDSGLPPQVRIAAPSNNSSISGTANVQLQTGSDSSITRIDLYAREIGSADPGQLLGTTSQPTDSQQGSASTSYVVSWNTGTLPNLAPVELYAVATGDGGEGTSDPVRLTVSNTGAPALSYFAGFNLPSGPIGIQRMRTLPHLNAVLPPLQPQHKRTTAPARPQGSDHHYAVEWAWTPIQGVAGYYLNLSQKGLLGPYTRQHGQQPDGTSGLQRYSTNVDAPAPGAHLYGTVTAIASTGETPASNTTEAKFLPDQAASGPSGAVNARTLTLSWPANSSPDVLGYLYFVYTKNPLTDPGATPVWTNPGGRSTAQLSVAYPDTRDPLPAGTYYWWAVGVAFSDEGRPNGFSFSDLQSFTVQ